MGAEWNKRENDAGFPYYIREDRQDSKQWDHPAFGEILEKLNRLSNIKYAVYRMAYKIKVLQESLKVPSIRFISGVFAHHCLSISESSFVLEPCELEAILTDIYFAAQKDGSFDGNIDTASEIALNFLLNVYDSKRTSSVSIQSAKTALAILTNESNHAKWHFLFSVISDHNSCISPRRLTSLLTQIAMIAEYIGEGNNFGQHLVQGEVDKCFTKTPGMLGLSEHELFQWLEGESPPYFLTWLDVLFRINTSSKTINDCNANSNVSWKCSLCEKRNPSGLKFKCTRCWGMMICEKCYLYNDVKSSSSNGNHKHKKSHIIKEIIDSQGMPSHYIVNFMKNMKKVLYFPSNCRRGHNFSTDVRYPLDNRELSFDVSCKKSEGQENIVRNKENTHKVYTSTVGKVSGKNISDPKTILQDIILKLENQNRALKSISSLLNEQNMNSVDRRIQQKVDSHWGQIAAQIHRLKIFQETLLPGCQNQIPEWETNPPPTFPSQNVTIKNNNPQMPTFEAFSPIPTMPKECMNETIILEHKKMQELPKYKSTHEKCDLGNDKNVDSISNVSMSDISTWFMNGIECEKSALPNSSAFPIENQIKVKKKEVISTVSEDKFNADIESVATSNNKMKELNADLDSVLDRLQTILTNNFALDEMNFDNTQLQETANEMEGLLGSLIRGVEQRRTIRGDKI